MKLDTEHGHGTTLTAWMFWWHLFYNYFNYYYLIYLCLMAVIAQKSFVNAPQVGIFFNKAVPLAHFGREASPTYRKPWSWNFRFEAISCLTAFMPAVGLSTLNLNRATVLSSNLLNSLISQSRSGLLLATNDRIPFGLKGQLIITYGSELMLVPCPLGALLRKV